MPCVSSYVFLCGCLQDSVPSPRIYVNACLHDGMRAFVYMSVCVCACAGSHLLSTECGCEQETSGTRGRQIGPPADRPHVFCHQR